MVAYFCGINTAAMSDFKSLMWWNVLTELIQASVHYCIITQFWTHSKWRRHCTLGFPGSPVVKNPPVSAADARDTGSIHGSRRSPAEGKSNPLQYSCLENPMDREAWWATVHGITKSDMTEQLSRPHTYTVTLVLVRNKQLLIAGRIECIFFFSHRI